MALTPMVRRRYFRPMRYFALLPALLLLAAGPSENPPTGADCSPEAVRQFSTKVQPVLQNACMSCHAGGDGGTLKLRRRSANGANAFAVTQANLSAALAFVDRKTPAASPLLAKSLQAHGGARNPPLPGPNHPAYRHLELWVRMTAGPNVAPNQVPMQSGAEAANGPITVSQPLGAAAHHVIRDEFDPEIFNQETKDRQ